jgi:hypothetical protein
MIGCQFYLKNIEMNFKKIKIKSEQFNVIFAVPVSIE